MRLRGLYPFLAGLQLRALPAPDPRQLSFDDYVKARTAAAQLVIGGQR